MMTKIVISSQFLFLSFCFTVLPFSFGATTHPDEVEALKEIGKALGKKDWDYNVDPCSAQASPSWVTPPPLNGLKINKVTCNCFIANDNFCHVVEIILAAQNLQGTLPRELIRLPYLQQIDFSLNYLSGTIPKEWGSLNLRNLTLGGNRLSGPIPAELANVTTLKSLTLEANQFSENLPGDLGNLPHLEILHLSSNNFTGNLPYTFSKLTTLTDVRLGDNQFSGKIPDFIEKWTNLNILEIQASGFSGPIPSGISSLQKLTDLTVSDLKGPDSSFPPVNITGLERLILRGCNIKDTLPEYIGNFKGLKVLDLSYNKLSGGIPRNLEELTGVMYIYLTGNFLTGSVPNWREGSAHIDLSYNNFSNENSESQRCQEQNMNLFASFSRGNDSGPVSCVRSNDCSKTFHSFHVNCGGEQKTIGNTAYDRDLDVSDTAMSKLSGANWAISNTGHLLHNTFNYTYTPQNISRLSVTDAEAKLYMTARISPISLTYYGFCLENGSYTVKLHFAEIMFTDDNTYSSLGRRVFDVYIQGKRVLKDFNIANEARGVGKALIKQFPAYVSSSTLEIRFYWAGKGTTGIPNRSVYGPLISAISVSSGTNSISAGAEVAVVAAAAIIIIILIVGMLRWRCCLGKPNSLAKELNDLQTGLFSLRQIKVATNNFDISNKIGEGGFGPVYKGILSDGTLIAVKQLSSKSKQGNREFINEIGLISALQHPCLVKLHGCCAEGDQLLLVYEYMENNSLAHALFGPEECSLKLNWPTRHKICVGIARGLDFLHEKSRLKIVHRDIKATNVLLDEDLNPKISDFGLAKLDEEDNTHISTRIAGTYGYMAPEYAMHGYLTHKADVYSFGIVALEIVSGKRNTIHRSKEEALYLLDWVHLLKEKDKLLELVDGRLGSDFNEEEVMVMIKVALLCTNGTSSLRPTMSAVVNMFEGRTVVPEFVSDASEVMDEMKLEAMRQHYNEIEENNVRETRSQSLSNDEPWTASSSSGPVHPDSSYWETKKLREYL